MAALTVLFLALGLWQLQRLGEKTTIIAAIESRENLPPEPLPGPGAWAGLDTAGYDYRPVSLTGVFRYDQTIRVFTSLGEDARGRYSGAGYWVMTPLALAGGGSVFVNRGFVPEAMAAVYADGGPGPAGLVTVTGLARLPELGNSFIPGAEVASRIDYLRNVDRLAALVAPDLAPFAPLYVDLPASAPGDLPQGGETILDIPNRHLEYVLTWFSLAAVTPLLLGVWWWGRRKKGGV